MIQTMLAPPGRFGFLANPEWDISADTDILHFTDENGWGIIHHVVKYNRPEFIAPLVRLGAAIDIPDRIGRTPLHYAAWYRFTEMIVALMSFNAMGDLPDMHGWTPVFTVAATMYGRAHNCLQLLLALGCDPDILPEEGFLDVQLETIVNRLRRGCSEREIRKIRQRVYFQSSLLTRLLFWIV